MGARRLGLTGLPSTTGHVDAPVVTRAPPALFDGTPSRVTQPLGPRVGPPVFWRALGSPGPWTRWEPRGPSEVHRIQETVSGPSIPPEVSCVTPLLSLNPVHGEPEGLGDVRIEGGR